MEKVLTFEVPICLLVQSSTRIEYLISKLHTYIQRDFTYDIQTCVSTFVELLTVLERQELRSKYFQTFSHAYHLLSRMTKNGVCQTTLETTLSKLKAELNLLSNKNGKFASSLRDKPFFKQIMQHHHLPAAESGQSSPEYLLWLNQPSQQCQSDMETWLAEFHDIDEISRTHLSFIRDSGQFQQEVAQTGFFQQHMDGRFQLIRINVPTDKRVFPRITAGQHGISIQFFKFTNINEPVEKDTSDTPFNIAYCFLS